MKLTELQYLLSHGKTIQAATEGRRDVQTLVPGYEPCGPHFRGTKRPDASWFDANSWDELMDSLRHVTAREIQHDEKAVIVSEYIRGVVGVTKKSTPMGDGPWIVTIGPHGPMAKGKAEIEERLTNSVTLIFTNEGDDTWVLATVHPGPAEEPGDYTNLKEGDELSKEDLDSRHITRVIPE